MIRKRYSASTSAANARTPASAWIRDDHYSWVASGMLWLLLVLMTLPKDFVSLFSNPPPPSLAAAGTAINSLLWVLLMVVGVMMLLWRARLGLLLLRHVNVGLLIFCVLVLASLLWSAAPGITLDRFRRLLIILVCCMVAMLVGWNQRRFQDLIRLPITTLLAGSIVYGVFFPTLAIHQSDQPELVNAWHGLMFQKNVFGSVAAYGVILWFYAWLSREAARWQIVVGLVISGSCVLLSRSSTSLLTTAFAVFFLTLALRSPANLRRYTPYFVAFFVVIVALYAMAALGLVPALQALLDPITAATGKDALNASGRAPIWALIKAEIDRHPWLGIGYGAYWVGPIPGTASYIFVTAIYFYAGSAHNGYLDVTNDLGFVGLACLIVYILVYIRQSLQVWRIDRQQSALFLALLFQQGLENLSEAQWLQVTTVNFVVMTLATCAIARLLLEQKLQSYFATPGPAVRPQRADANRSAAVSAGRMGARPRHR